jgi:hypothetical protein
MVGRTAEAGSPNYKMLSLNNIRATNPIVLGDLKPLFLKQ